MVNWKKESFNRINYMALPKLHLQVVTLIGGKTRMVRRKVMEHLSGLMEGDTSGNTCRMFHMGMEYSDGQMEMYFKDKSNKIKEKVMDITEWQVEPSIMDSTKMIRSTERE